MNKVNLILLVSFFLSSKDLMVGREDVTTNFNGDNFYFYLDKIEKDKELFKF